VSTARAAGLSAAAAAFVLTAGFSVGATGGAATHTIVMEGVAYRPATITVNAGDKVVWANKDPFPHTATAQDKSFDSREIAAAKTWTYVAKKKGTFAYVCTYHPTMKGTLVVK
jgi:plastocyanin